MKNNIFKSDYDVIVCGGGPAGIGAAIAAARGGVRTLLVEQLGHVGGMPTSADLVAFCDTMGGPVYDELVDMLIKMDAGRYAYDPKNHHKPGRLHFHAETMKAVAMKMLQEAEVEVLLHTIATGAHLSKRKAVEGVFIANKSGYRLIRSKFVVDATADGDIAANAGAEFLKGDPADGRIQHVNFRYSIGGIDKNAFGKSRPNPEQMRRLFRNAIRKKEINPPDNIFSPLGKYFPYNAKKNQLSLAYWEIEKVDPSDAFTLSSTLAQCHAAACDVVSFCRKHIPGHENAKIAHLPATLGTRESRRILGDYVLTKDDVVKGRKFKDAVAKANFWIDLHDSPPGQDFTTYSAGHKKNTRPAEGDWFDIPLRCLTPKGFKGILVAGRCISADRAAQAATRMIPTCFYTGHASGKYAATQIRNKK
ncbi:MAG TPA: hypothetical protein DCZ94_15565 [Lentisphaeria bacterium]|nr:MAG: hypothetical protein A2X48_17050 [Lentisphaerae bacterium GWF2_49_21]HBC88367.1 hypothetical protein [Lentisphaeria bacterium]